MNETRGLVEFLAGLRNLPSEVVDRTRYLLLDYLGVAIRGSREESSAPVYKMIERLNAHSQPGYTALATARRRTPSRWMTLTTPDPFILA